MAYTGKVTKKVTAYNNLVFEWDAQGGASIKYNTTTVDWEMYLTSDGSNGTIDSTAGKPWSVTVDGRTYSGTNMVYINNGTTKKTLAKGSTIIEHNDDGTKTFSFSFWQDFNITFSGSAIYRISGSGSGTLPVIARASQPSLITWPETTNDVGNFGDTISIHMNRKADTLTHTVRYAFGERTGTIATGVETGTTWTIPLDFMNLLPDATQGSGLIYVDTYNGSTLVGTKYTGFTAKVPASVKPTCTVQVLDDTDTLDTYGNLVKGLSKLYVKVNGYPAYSSPIAAYSINANGAKYTTQEVVTGALVAAGTTTITGTVTDKRGRTSAAASASFPVLDYHRPTVTALSVHRCDEDGTEHDQGEFIQVTFSAAVTALNNKNTASYVLRYKKSTATSYTEIQLTALAGKYTVTDHIRILQAEPEASYDVEIAVTDNHSTTTRATSASTAFSLMDWHKSGTGLRFGGVAELEHTLQNDLSLRQVGNTYAFQPEAFNGAKGYTLLAVITLTALNVNAPIVFEINRRGALCPMRVYIRFASSSDTLDPGLGTITYEGDNYGAFLVKAAASTWELYVDNTSGWSNPCLQTWYTTENQRARMAVEFPSEQVTELPQPYYRATPAVLQSILDAFMPVGYVLILYSHADPRNMYPGTTWERITNAFLWAVDGSGTIGQTGGAKEVTLTEAQLPAHSHGSVYSQHATGTKNRAWYSTSGSSMAYGPVETGGGEAHNNMPPYVQVSIWRRTA